MPPDTNVKRTSLIVLSNERATSCTSCNDSLTRSTDRAPVIAPFRDDLGATMRGVTIVPNA